MRRRRDLILNAIECGTSNVGVDGLYTKIRVSV